MIFLECFIAFIILYWFSERLFSHIAVSEEVVSNPTELVYMTSNGVHTDFILPIRHGKKNWGQDLCIADELAKDTTRHYLAFGWGHKEFFLKTKSWDDLTVGVALRSTFHVGTAAMHVMQVAAPDTNNAMVIPLLLTKAQYHKLEQYIYKSFTRKENQCMMIQQHPYGERNFFFDSDYSYGLFYTCNSWTNDGLKACGQKATIWAAFKDGIYARYGK